MKTLIAIPARYGSTRFPGKPLAKIAGKEMLLRVWENAQKTAAKFEAQLPGSIKPTVTNNPGPMYLNTSNPPK